MVCREASRGKLPDVFMVLDTDFSQYCSLGALKNLDELIERDTGFDEADYFATALNSGKHQGASMHCLMRWYQPYYL